jgi:hypothetical protein
MSKMFEKRKLVIATKHEKEKVIAPLLEKELGVHCFVSQDFDSDILGTFTGEIARKEDPITTARIKCTMAMALTNCDMSIASEGSFGSHPSIFFAHADDEIILFIDKKNNLEIIARELSTETNFNAAEIKTEEQLKEFITNVKFPTHGLILRNTKDDYTEIEKGITDWESLKIIFDKFIQRYGSTYIETDMRAMYNPTRMKVIEKATKKLLEKIQSCCPECKTPGFGITDIKKGLPCELCNCPTRSTLSYSYSCQKCTFTKEVKYPNQKLTEDPMYCDFCNP